MSKEDILQMLDQATAPEVMTKAEALEFMEVLVASIGVRMACIEENMDVRYLAPNAAAKLPKVRAKSATRARAHEQVKTRFKIPKAKK